MNKEEVFLDSYDGIVKVTESLLIINGKKIFISEIMKAELDFEATSNIVGKIVSIFGSIMIIIGLFALIKVNFVIFFSLWLIGFGSIMLSKNLDKCGFIDYNYKANITLKNGEIIKFSRNDMVYISSVIEAINLAVEEFTYKEQYKNSYSISQEGQKAIQGKTTQKITDKDMPSYMLETPPQQNNNNFKTDFMN